MLFVRGLVPELLEVSLVVDQVALRGATKPLPFSGVELLGFQLHVK
jgi:hypothetical protein